MIIACTSCGRKYSLDPERLGGKPAKVRCSACGTTIEGAPHPPPGARTPRLPADASLLPAPGRVLAGTPFMPSGVRVSLAVLQGPEAGKMIRIERPSVIIGRHDADVVLEDPEVSRQHARLEIHGNRAVLHDLGSTNGTFVNDRKVSEAEVENQGEFRVGGTRLMLILTGTAESTEGET
jgi:predicted Zn finger-like uncharacterized protein